VVAAGDAGDPRGGALDVLADTIQPFPTPSEIDLKALQELCPTGVGADCLAPPRPPWSPQRLNQAA
jgi:hypothetical protein